MAGAAINAETLLSSEPARVALPTPRREESAPPPPAPPVIQEEEGFQCTEGYRNFTLTGRVEMTCTGIPSVSMLAYARNHHERVFVYRPGLHEDCNVSLRREGEIDLQCPAVHDAIDGNYPGLVIPPDPFRGVGEGEPTVTGPIAPDVIRRVVRENIVRFRVCYEESLRDAPKLAGWISTTFDIRDGAVTWAWNAGASTSNAYLIACVAHAFSRLAFPRRIERTRVLYPLDFTPG